MSGAAKMFGGDLMSVAFRGGVKSPARECRSRFRDGLVEVTWFLEGYVIFGIHSKGNGKIQRKETYKRTSRQQKPMVGYYEGKNTYVQRVVKSCGRSLRHFLQTRPKIIISKYLMLIEQYFFADLINA